MFLVVKVNCSSYAFDVIKQSVDIEQHHNNKKIVEKGPKSSGNCPRITKPVKIPLNFTFQHSAM